MSAPFMWFDLTSSDSGKTAGFYRELFGWNITEAPSAGYQAWIGAGQPWAGVTEAAAGSPALWLPYVVVDDLAAAKDKAVALGATVVRDAADGPAGTSVWIADPTGAQVALFKPFPATP